MVRADYALRSAASAAAAGDWPRAQTLIEQGLDLQGTRAPYLDAAASLFAHRFGATGDRSLYDRAARLFEAAQARSPFSEYFMIHRLDLETAALQKQKGGAASQGANDAAAALLAVDRHNGTVYESLARMRLAEGAAPQALDMITRAEALRPHQADYWRLEGDIRRAMGDRRAAVAAYRHAAAGLPPGTAPWVNATRRLVVTLIEAGDYSAAIDEATRALAVVPGDVLMRQLFDAAAGAKRAAATES
jgi:tetratricopeptide (TPR) repeat protein